VKKFPTFYLIYAKSDNVRDNTKIYARHSWEPRLIIARRVCLYKLDGARVRLIEYGTEAHYMRVMIMVCCVTVSKTFLATNARCGAWYKICFAPRGENKPCTAASISYVVIRAILSRSDIFHITVIHGKPGNNGTAYGERAHSETTYFSRAFHIWRRKFRISLPRVSFRKTAARITSGSTSICQYYELNSWLVTRNFDTFSRRRDKT